MITILGSLNMDLILHTARIPKVGETVLGHDFRQVPGGKGANQAVAAARLGASVAMIGAVGRDDMGAFLLRQMKKDGIDTSLIWESEQPTGLAMILVDDEGHNSITVASGANFDLKEEQLQQARPILEKSSIFLAQLENPLPYVSEALKQAHSLGLRTVLNPAPAAPLESDMMASIDILTPNESELSLLSGGLPTETPEDCMKAGQRLLDQGLSTLLVTRGADGCLYMDGKETKVFPAYRVPMKDSTAAGDCFNGALVAALEQGSDLFAAIDFAMRAAAISVTREGAQPSLPRLEEVRAFDAWYGKQEI